MKLILRRKTIVNCVWQDREPKEGITRLLRDKLNKNREIS